MKDYYKILNIEKNANKDEIKSAYKKLALQYHPDKNPNNKALAENKFKEISEAYSILSDPQKKNNYDNGNNIIINRENPFDIFNNIFNHSNNIFDVNINNFSNVQNLSNQTFSSSINTTTTIVGNKKITKIEKTEYTPNGNTKTIEEHIEYI